MVTLESSKLFSQLAPAEREALRQLTRERTVRRDEALFKEGDAGDGVYVLKQGAVEISLQVGQNERQVFALLQPGDVFGEMAILEDKPRSATAVARQESVVYFIPRAGMLALVERSPALAMGLLREISHRLREFNQQYLREVLQVERMAVVGRFAGSIIHDLKNPLNIIGLSAEMVMLEQAPPAARQQAAGVIRKQVDRISEMIAEILEFTQGASPDLMLPPMDYGEFVTQVVEEIRPEASLKAARLELETVPPSVPLLLNPKRLRRVFCNLIHNATEAMPAGGAIRLRFQTTPTEVVTEIEDSGPGLPPEMLDRLFQPFATHGKTHGTGLGLSICKRIVEDHRGWIAARHEPQRGAIFAFGLPRALDALKR